MCRDLRSSSTILGSLSESLGDDVTQVEFHPTADSMLCTGSTDGLVCVFDLAQLSDEYEALASVLNTQSSVSQIGFYGPAWENLYALTHIETMSLWSLQTVSACVCVD